VTWRVLRPFLKICFLENFLGAKFGYFGWYPRGVGAPGKPIRLIGKSIMAGYVYAFASPSMAGIVKVGATTHDPTARLADANSADTWRPPEPYELVCSAHVPSAFATERALHTILGARRVNARREFFSRQ
jgi:hypothetical protein